MMPAFSPAIPAISGTEIVDVINADRGDDGDRALITLVASQRPPMPTLDHCHVDGRVRQSRERHRGEHLELAHRRATLTRSSDRWSIGATNGSISRVGRHIPRRVDRLAVDRNAFHPR